jgi:glucose-1-phosphate thymidylyltransferase
VEVLGRGYAWLDTGTHESLHQAANFIQTLEQRQGLKIACIEEIAYRLGYIDSAQLAYLAAPMAKSSYGRYLLEILSDDAVAAPVQDKGNDTVVANRLDRELSEAGRGRL